MIDNLEEKLDGQIPITRDELIFLVNSWGRKEYQITMDNIHIENCCPKECYELSNLDVSEITNLSFIFRYSYYNGNLSKWNISSCLNMISMFSHSDFNNDSLNYWNTSNVKDIDYIFYKSKFNGNISNFDISNITTMISIFDSCPFDGDISKWKFNPNVSCTEIFCDNKNFENKYNDCKEVPYLSKDFLEWFEENRTKIASLNISKNELIDMDDYLSNFDVQTINNKDN